ncbi:MAG: COX15/CtaA family protein [Acidobacteria bacterium]|nr:COX15/CtaA family protein [Acidobacteriota bacterium]
MSCAYQPGLHRFAVLTACCTFLLLIAGALVTSNDAGLAVPDWPLSYGSFMPPMVGGIFYEHGHRMVATFVGLLTIVLSVWLWRVESRVWMRWLGLSALGGVILQGVLGGLTVKFFLPPSVSTAHAGLAQLFFCTTIAIALFTGKWWTSVQPKLSDTGTPSLRRMAAITFAAIFIQLLLGASFRHKAFGVFPHIIFAAVVLASVSWTSAVTRRRFENVSALRRPAVFLSAMIGAQLFLGGGSLWAVLANRQFPQPQWWMVAVTVVHLVVGALSLATATLLALCSHRLLAPEQVFASNQSQAARDLSSAEGAAK